MNDARNEQTTVIAPGTAISGEMTFNGPTSVLGELNGKITSTDRVEVGRDARVAAEVVAENVLVDGAIEGNVTARDKLQLNDTATLHGDVLARTLIVSEGASFIGHCKVGADNSAPTRDTRNASTKANLTEPKTALDDDELPLATQLQHAS